MQTEVRMSVATQFVRSISTRFDRVAQALPERGYAPIMVFVAHCLLAYLLRDLHAFMALTTGAVGIALFGGMTAWDIVRQERFGAAIRAAGFAGLVMFLAYRAGLVPGLHIFLVAFTLTWAYVATGELFAQHDGDGFRAYVYAALVGLATPLAMLFAAYRSGAPGVMELALWCGAVIMVLLSFRHHIIEQDTAQELP
jgi:Na+/H+-translocating membrane pyrophosphatase